MAEKKLKPDLYTTKNKNNPGNEEGVDTNILFLLPILFIVAILPLIVRLHIYHAHLSDNVWFSEEDEYADFFLYWKQMIFIGLSAFMAVVAAYRSFKDRKSIHIPRIFIPLAVYAILALLSTLMSKYSFYGFHGIFEQFESVFALLGYCVTAYYVSLIVKTEKQIKYIIGALCIGALILSFIGLTQIANKDFLMSMPGWRLITARGYWGTKDLFSFNFQSIVYLTLFNPNYVGTYAGMVLPILAIAASITKKMNYKIALIAALLGIAISLLGSKSSTGFASVVFAILLSIIFFRRYLVKHYKVTIPVIILMVISVIFINIKFDNLIIYQFQKITNTHKSTPALTEIQTNDNNLVIKYNNNTLQVDFYLAEDGTYKFNVYDDQYMPVNHISDATNGSVTLQDDRFPGFVFAPCMNADGAMAFSVLIDGYTWYFTNQVLNNSYYYINDYGKYDKMMTAPSAIFTGHENYASNRGYIWSRSIPLLKDNIILGSGADSFTFLFPNRDYVNKYNSGYISQLISKPHNMYLQTGIQTGVLSLIAFLCFYLIYLISSIRLYINGRFTNDISYIGVAILISTACYMISGIANDSNITVSPVFWVMIGLGIAVNQIVRNEKKQQA